MAAASGAKIASAAVQFDVKQHEFLRVDMEQSSGTSRVYHSYVQTLAGHYLLTLELFSASQSELQQLVASLQSISITDDDR